MDFGHARLRLVQSGAAFLAAALVAGCGSQYRAPVTPINPTGPPSQPTSLVAVVSAPSPTAPGIATIIDYSGDTVMAQAPIGPGPRTFTLDEGGSTGYTVNSDGTLSNFPVSTSLQAKNISYSTLPSAAQPVNLYSPAAGLWIADLNGDIVDYLIGFPQTFRLAIPVAAAPIMIAGPGLIQQHNYAISQDYDGPSGGNANGVACNSSPTTAPVNGEADAMETSSFTLSARIPLGLGAGPLLAKCPVYAVLSSDYQRLFVLNRGSDTVTVINTQTDALDGQFDASGNCVPFRSQTGQIVTCHPILPLSTAAVTASGITPPNGTTGMGATAGPVYAEYNAATAQLVVSNYDGNTISVIDVSLDEYGNDSPTFGTTFTIPVGINPASVTVLADGSRAYTANQGDCTPSCTPSSNGTVTIVNLSSHTVEKTLPVIGHPRTVVSTQNSLYGKVYVASPDSPYLTILRTDQDIVDTTILIEGNIVDVRVTTQNGSSGNSNVYSRIPGHGQPCYLPPSMTTSKYGANYTLADCQMQP